VSDLAKAHQVRYRQGHDAVPRGTLSIDERTNTLLVQDTAEKLADIRRLVQTLDVPVRQVLIEARIVIVNDTFERDLGARFGITTAQQNGNNGLLAVTGNGVGADTLTGSAANNLAKGSPIFPVTAPILNNRYQVNLPVANPAGTIGLSLLHGANLLDLELSAARTKAAAK